MTKGNTKGKEPSSQAVTRRSKTVPAKTPAAAGAERPYHHGALREALLQASEEILAEEGINGLTLRAAARRAGASHAAPKNHFDDLTGLLSELAAVGFRRFSAELRDAAANEPDPERRGAARGRAYVRFAERHPGLFQLMFRSERLDPNRPALREAMDDATVALAEAVGVDGHTDGSDGTTLSRAARMVSAWSLVHGFSMLLLDGRIKGIMKTLPGDMKLEDLLDAILGLRRS